jgi:exodeoxyribonuclease VII small subunit
MSRSRKKIDFEKSLAALEAIVHQLEDGDLSLEESLAAFEQGVKLTRECQAALDAAEQRVQLLMEQGDQSELVDFNQEAAPPDER